MKRKPFIAGNWKMHKSIKEAAELANEIKRRFYDFDRAEIVLAPPFTALAAVADIIASTPVKLAAQNMFWEKEGAFTGEVSPLMLKDAGCSYVILGHSERRAYFCESDENVNKKIKAALREGILPIVCVGERLEEREAGKTIEVVERQLRGALEEIKEEEARKIVIAYEPVWAIGTGKTAAPNQAEEVHKFIRETIGKLYTEDTSSDILVIYGGSVKPENITFLIKEEDIDGALVGGASLESDKFIKIIEGAVLDV
ncbi:MAG: triose-phosphate isomerase [Candidatus Omnitrophica bacterium]|nr:triose-phosphate isomerase [Candidatus Omnitrophota bacterium]